MTSYFAISVVSLIQWLMYWMCIWQLVHRQFQMVPWIPRYLFLITPLCSLLTIAWSASAVLRITGREWIYNGFLVFIFFIKFQISVIFRLWPDYNVSHQILIQLSGRHALQCNAKIQISYTLATPHLPPPAIKQLVPIVVTLTKPFLQNW